MRLYRSVGPGWNSQRNPRFTVNFRVARQSFWENTAKYFCAKAGQTFSPGRTHQTFSPTSSAAPLMPAKAGDVFCGADAPLAVVYSNVKLPHTLAQHEGISADASSIS